ncbi:MAG: hypothetical protein U0636_10350 [Phycisphaerales bacterium]
MDAPVPSGRSAATAAALASLAERVARIEGRVAASVLPHPTFTTHAADGWSHPSQVPTGWPVVDAALGGGLPQRGLHEWWHVEDHPQARRPPLDVFIHLAWQAVLHDDHHHPGEARRVVWVGRAVWPQAQAMVRGLRVPAQAMFGAPCPVLWPDAALVHRSLLVEVPPADVGARLWAVEQAARCAGVCAVIADGAGLDLPATRRLQLAAQQVLLLVARPGAHRAAQCLSACTTRWLVRSHVAEAPAPHAAPAPLATPASLATPVPLATPAPLDTPAPPTARLPPEPVSVVELQRVKGSSGAGARTHVTRAWQTSGADHPAQPLVAEAQRRRKKKEARAAARAAARPEEVRSHDHAHSYPMLSGHHAAEVGVPVRRRARRAR